MAVQAIRKRPWFAYFSEDYRWSFITSMALIRTKTGAAETSEIFEICRRLESHVGDDRAWFREWSQMGERIRDMGLADQHIVCLICLPYPTQGSPRTHIIPRVSSGNTGNPLASLEV